ncbi:MAG: UDP-3-O-(3-hydroxymyristoyl)glucosamine N-acyltransferase [Sulfurovum sp.]
MTYTLSKITEHIGLDFQGEDITIEGIHTLSEATSSQLSFFTDSKYASQLADTKAAAVLIDEKHAALLPSGTIALITDEAYLKLALVSKFFAHKLGSETEQPTVGEGCDIDKNVSFGKNVTLGDNVTLLAGCYVGDNVTIGSGTLLHPNVTLYHHTKIGSECIIHSGTVIGCDGYGFAHTKHGEHVKIYQNGNVVVEDDVEIGANCTIDRAVFGTTYIRKGTKLDNLIQIAHNCDVGEHSLCAAQVGLAGSTTLGRNVVMGGQSATAGHLEVGAFATIAGKGGVTKSLEGGKTYAGFPAIDHKMWLRLQAKMMGLVKGKK